MPTVVTLALVFAASAVLLGTVPLLQWLGRLPPGNPYLVTQRAYLGLPYSMGLLLIAAAMLFRSLLGDGVGLVLIWLGVFMLFAGTVLMLWQPRWLRPRWQKEYMAEMGYDRPASSRRRRRRRRTSGSS